MPTNLVDRSIKYGDWDDLEKAGSFDIPHLAEEGVLPD